LQQKVKPALAEKLMLMFEAQPSSCLQHDILFPGDKDDCSEP
jgi:hypothetical protein